MSGETSLIATPVKTKTASDLTPIKIRFQRKRKHEEETFASSPATICGVTVDSDDEQDKLVDLPEHLFEEHPSAIKAEVSSLRAGLTLVSDDASAPIVDLSRSKNPCGKILPPSLALKLPSSSTLPLSRLEANLSRSIQLWLETLHA
ncbi:hypothetical protein E4U21_006901 [Claviceps maximensis]|nr:hypothetical protein E4U21_006901 [Claviceps maximensis]